MPVIQKLTLCGYKFLHVPRPSDGHGGVALLYKASVSVIMSSTPCKAKSFEAKITTQEGRTHLVVFYQPPPSPKTRLTVRLYLEEFPNFSL